MQNFTQGDVIRIGRKWRVVDWKAAAKLVTALSQTTDFFNATRLEAPPYGYPGATYTPERMTAGERKLEGRLRKEGIAFKLSDTYLITDARPLWTRNAFGGQGRQPNGQVVIAVKLDKGHKYNPDNVHVNLYVGANRDLPVIGHMPIQYGAFEPTTASRKPRKAPLLAAAA